MTLYLLGILLLLISFVLTGFLGYHAYKWTRLFNSWRFPLMCIASMLCGFAGLILIEKVVTHA